MKKRSLSRNLSIYLSFLLLPAFAFAQKATVKGKVLDENNQPLPGAAVYIKGTGTGVLSLDDGSYTIQVPDQSKNILVASYTGYFSKEAAVNGITTHTFLLLRNAVKLKDVEVVSALGLSRQSKTIGYSQQSVDPERLTEARDVNIAAALAGKVSGIQVTTSGQPTGSVRIVIRGDNSITGNNQPLWVVDGVPIDNSMGDGRNNLDYGNGAADLNPDDIANIEVLKGPNAAALYGSKAANGAILITTKKGKSKEDGSLGVSVNQNMMWYTISEYPAYQNVYGEGNAFRTVQNTNNIVPGTNAINMGTGTRSWGSPMLGQPYNGYDGKPHGYYPQPNNIKDLYQSSFTNVTNVSVGKSDERSNFRASYTYTDGNDVLAKQNVRKKHNFNLNSSRRLGKKVNLDARLMYTLDKVKNRTFRNMDPQSPMNAYIYMLRSIDEKALSPWRDAAGNAFSYGAQGDGYENPYWAIYENENEDIKHRVIGGTTLTIDLMEGLKFRGQISIDLTFGSGFVYREPGSRQSKLGSYSQFTQQNQTWNTEGLFMYTKKWGKEFSLNVNLGANFMSANQLFRQASVSSLLNHDMPSIANSNAYPVAQENLGRNKTHSVYGSATVGFRDFLFLDITSRNDWSSTLPEANRTFFYPSVSGSFLFSQFLPEEQDIISYGKLRASWARVGNDASAFNLQSMFNYGGLFLGNPWLDFENLRKNPALKPERTTSMETGVDISFFKDRLSVSTSFYKSNTVDQIMRAQVARESGFTEQIVNAGEIQNTGVELSIKGTPIRSKKFTWDVMLNWSKNENLVVSLTPGVNRYTLGSWYVMTSNAEVGKPYGVLRGNAAYYSGDTMMINITNGRPYFEPNGYLGNFRPDWIGSISNTFKYKGFDLSFLVTVKWGGDIYSVSNHKANVTGNTIQSLLGREDFYYSSLILGESGDEQNGIGLFGNSYQDKNRPKGIKYPGYNPVLNAQGAPVIGKDGRYIALKPNESWQSPQAYWQNMDNDMGNNLFDASNIRLSEVVMGYNFNGSNWLRNKFIRGARIALVGRNLWTIMKHTPRGIDPEAANTTGNAQGIEQGGSFPYATYGVDLKFNF